MKVEPLGFPPRLNVVGAGRKREVKNDTKVFDLSNLQG